VRAGVVSARTAEQHNGASNASARRGAFTPSPSSQAWTLLDQ